MRTALKCAALKCGVGAAIAALVLAGCGSGRDDDETAAAPPAGVPAPAPGGSTPGAVESASTVAVARKADIDGWAVQAGAADLAGPALCDVQIDQVVHRTLGPGDVPARISAALLTPVAAPGCTGPFPLLAYARGTSSDRSRTLADPTDRETRALMMFFAARGFVVVATDYLGYGQSDFPYVPYLDASVEARSVADSLVAAISVAAARGLPRRPGLLLAGYSLGGHAILAAQRLLEQTPIAGEPVIATGAMSGPYDLAVTFREGSDAAVFPSLGDDAARVAASPATLLLAGVITAAAGRFVGIPAVRDRLAAESVTGWRPQAPVLLCGGARDPIVPFENTTVAAADFTARGAAVTVVEVDSDPAYAARVPPPGSPTVGTLDYHAQVVPPLCVQAVRDRLFAPRLP
ncbi:MAG TPA: hypothetical protein PKA20_09985 [Burkholderiaceae bacterium]|nr:hypothetical protein [Burkholderiaceae bacterium]